MTQALRSQSTRRVLLVNNDRFEAGYLRTVLEDQHLYVLGPYKSGAAALDVLHAERIDAAIVADDLSGGVTDALQQQGIPYLSLMHQPATGRPLDRPVLVRPFAAYQVAEWVIQTGAYLRVGQGHAR